MLTFNKITRYGSGCSKDFRQASLLPVNKPKSGFNIMNIYGDKNYFDPNFRYYDPLTDTHEEFRDIVGFEGRNQVSNFGRVLSIKTPKAGWRDQIIQPMNNLGYLVVDLRGKFHARCRKIHRLVATAFLANPDNLPDINHKDTNKLNNFYHNLEWSTTSHNVKHSWDNNLQIRPIGVLSAKSKFTNDDVIDVINRLNNGETCVDIAIKYSVAPRTIYRIKWGKSYQYHTHLINKE